MDKTSATLEVAPFLKAFAEVGLKAEAIIEVREIAKAIVERAQAIVHVGGAGDPKAGETRDSIMILGEGVDAIGPWIDVGSKLPKAFYEEFGSIHGPAVAFLRIAIAVAMSDKGGFGVSWKQMHRPPHSKNPTQAKNPNTKGVK